ncbi:MULTISPECIES: oligopeptide ABC transporter permease OppB [unclassified Cocleimonas]|jgi:oligopeptide transport system permease protein|uniref:oligopeptide ABC transporter permease OppB n=1 Tax=unclassified Cocleimonas TaxID=2639732 RepID=UPI002614D7AA|nr:MULTISPECIES: oligopeptide ABC transporter permease OppB [unclassified Cocleimonas]MEB8433138.1 oligopeptide ABC transporter permease OppB [Cocleimonas sp. KMM 6892]MEC4715881.1 oligopeptide ABC transporter permease OppB [Cocleimonas sp. KMM 6895]MEC4745342.1 oligopeptide ABC transporter permease OppB [Cocleimonas sp. KMM 6896]
MLSYFAKRIASSIPTLFIIITIAFFMIRLAPGGPFDSERPVPAEIAANLEKVYHLNDPLPVQYGYYLLNVLKGDFGPSFKYHDFTVSELIAQGFPVSIQLGLLAILLSLMIGVLLGVIAALRQNSAIDYLVMGLAMTGITIPNFVMAPILILLFGVFWGLLPTSGWGELKHMVLPVIVLSLPQIATVARMTRASLIETLNMPYIRTAKAKGLPTRLILSRHASRATLLPILSWLGPATAAIITGSVVVETIFGLPGIGRHFINGALNRDYTLVMGVVVFYGFLIILMNLLVDLLYAWLDPRIKY